jgi:hypothetical protein
MFKELFGSSDNDHNYVTKEELNEIKKDFKDALNAYHQLYTALDKKINMIIKKEEEDHNDKENYKSTLLKSVDDITHFLQDIDKIHDKIKASNNEKLEQFELKLEKINENKVNNKIMMKEIVNDIIDTKFDEFKKYMDLKVDEKINNINSVGKKARKTKTERSTEPKIRKQTTKKEVIGIKGTLNEEVIKPKKRKSTKIIEESSISINQN